jgi:hypothetical protein
LRRSSREIVEGLDPAGGRSDGYSHRLGGDR